MTIFQGCRSSHRGETVDSCLVTNILLDPVFLGVNPWVGDLALAKTPTQYITQLQEYMQRTLRMLSHCLHNMYCDRHEPS